MKYGITFHFILGYFLIGKHYILTTETQVHKKDHDSLHLEKYYLYFAVITGISNVLLWFFCQKEGFVYLKSCSKKCETVYNEQVISENFYDEINLEFVLKEYQRASTHKSDYEQILFENKDGTSNFEEHKAKYIRFV